jgi:carbon storage regulator CsrA
MDGRLGKHRYFSRDVHKKFFRPFGLKFFITDEVLEVRGGRVRFGIQAPQGVTVFREELLREVDAGVQRTVKQRMTSTL